MAGRERGERGVERKGRRRGREKEIEGEKQRERERRRERESKGETDTEKEREETGRERGRDRQRKRQRVIKLRSPLCLCGYDLRHGSGRNRAKDGDTENSEIHFHRLSLFYRVFVISLLFYLIRSQVFIVTFVCCYSSVSLFCFVCSSFLFLRRGIVLLPQDA